MDHFIKFKSETFDYKGPIPDDYNAGNKFYGADVSKALQAVLSRHFEQVACLDEDWGWYLDFSDQGGTITEIGIYNEPAGEDDEPTQGHGSNVWYIRFGSMQKIKRFGLLPGKKKAAPPENLLSLLKSFIIQNEGEILEISIDEATPL